MMTALGIAAWAFYSAIVIVPFWRLLPLHGWPKELAVISVFPFLALFLLWLIAFGDRIAPRSR